MSRFAVINHPEARAFIVRDTLRVADVSVEVQKGAAERITTFLNDLFKGEPLLEYDGFLYSFSSLNLIELAPAISYLRDMALDTHSDEATYRCDFCGAQAPFTRVGLLTGEIELSPTCFNCHTPMVKEAVSAE